MNLLTHLVRHIIVLHEEHLQLTDADAQITGGEFIRDVESERTKLSPLYHDAVEQGQREHQTLELMGLLLRKDENKL